jgi:inorganic pyrophosphatase
MRFISLVTLLIISISCTGQNNDQTRIETHNFLDDFEAVNDSGLVNVVIEIPAGSNQKWEVEKETGHLAWEIAGDSLRVISYLPYPANYGMVPRTWLPENVGGDGDPIDIFVIGPALERGSVVNARVIGVIKMIDTGEQDDKLIAVDTNSWFYGVHNYDSLQSEYPGIVEILITWLQNYKGDGVVEIIEMGDEEEAERILQASIKAYQNQPNR